MVDNDEPIDYFDIGASPIRVAHSIGSVSTPREISAAIEGEEDDQLVQKLQAQIRKRKQIMRGLDEEIRFIQDKIEEIQDSGGD